MGLFVSVCQSKEEDYFQNRRTNTLPVSESRNRNCDYNLDGPVSPPRPIPSGARSPRARGHQDALPPLNNIIKSPQLEQLNTENKESKEDVDLASKLRRTVSLKTSLNSLNPKICNSNSSSDYSLEQLSGQKIFQKPYHPVSVKSSNEYSVSPKPTGFCTKQEPVHAVKAQSSLRRILSTEPPQTEKKSRRHVTIVEKPVSNTSKVTRCVPSVVSESPLFAQIDIGSSGSSSENKMYSGDNRWKRDTLLCT